MGRRTQTDIVPARKECRAQPQRIEPSPVAGHGFSLCAAPPSGPRCPSSVRMAVTGIPASLASLQS